MIKWFISLLCIGLFSFQGLCQTKKHYLVEFEAFTPSEKDLTASFKGFPAEGFLENYVDSTEHFLSNYKGKVAIIWFWSIYDPSSISRLNAMNLLQTQYLEEVKVLGFASEMTEETQNFVKQEGMVFSNIPNGDVFGQIAYGADLGKPSAFIIDKDGIIQYVLPSSYFERSDVTGQSEKLAEMVRNLLFG